MVDNPLLLYLSDTVSSTFEKQQAKTNFKY